MMLSDVCLSVCLSDVCLTSVAYIRSAGGVCGRPAGWRVLADRARPAWLKAAAARFRCRPGAYRGGRPPTACLESCSFEKHRLILIILEKNIRTLSKMMCQYNVSYLLYFYMLLNSSD